MTPLTFPQLPGQGWSVHKRPSFSTRVASHVSGREVRSALYAATLYEFELTFDGLVAGGGFGGLGGLGADRQPGRAAGRHGDAAAARQVVAGQRSRVGRHLGIGALRHHLAAVDAGPGTHVHDMVGGTDHVLVVLDHDHAVALVTQLLQEFIEAVYVARVHADAGFVKDIQYVHKAAAQVFDHLDALRLAA